MSLFEESNPLEERLGSTFFKELPKTPGIYKMFGPDGDLLYVGKAKNLRSRLFTYRRASNNNSSRKIQRLVQLVHDIAIETLPTEQQALLRENELIRGRRPPFNQAKKAPETYYYISAAPKENSVHFKLQMKIPDYQEEYIFGAFKGHRRVRRAMGGLLRQLYIAEYQISNPFELPVQLSRNLTPMQFRLKLPDKIQRLQNLYLRGESDQLLSWVMDEHRKHHRLESFFGRLIFKDMEALRWFFERSAHRNFEIYRRLGLERRLIPQHKLDDYLVKLAFLKDQE